MRGPYAYETIFPIKHRGWCDARYGGACGCDTPEDKSDTRNISFRVRDGDDNRIATCYVEDNAKYIVAALNHTYPEKT